MFEIGRLCIKIAGRDSNKKCVIIDVVDDKTVLIDGETRRRKCNIKHLEPLDQVLKVSKNAKFLELSKVFKDLGIALKETKPKKASSRPKRKRKKKEKPVEEVKKEAKPKKEAIKKASKPKKD